MNIQGGDQFERRLNEIATLASNASAVAVGFLQEARYPDGTPVALIAAINAWGAPNNRMFGGAPAPIPPRPFFRNMITKHQAEWGPAVGELLIENGYDALKTLQMTGEAIAGQLRQSIVDTNDPALSETTLRMRGVSGTVYNPKDSKTFGAKPLIATGHLFNSVDYQVKA